MGARCTGVSLPVGNESPSKDLSEEKQMELVAKLRNMLALIIDERSMIASMLTGGPERNVRHVRSVAKTDKNLGPASMSYCYLGTTSNCHLL